MVRMSKTYSSLSEADEAMERFGYIYNDVGRTKSTVFVTISGDETSTFLANQWEIIQIFFT